MSTPTLVTRWTSWSPHMHALLRIVTGFLFIWPGSMNLFGYPEAMPGGLKFELMSQIRRVISVPEAPSACSFLISAR